MGRGKDGSLLAMGIYDREYSRDEPRGIVLGGDWSITTWLIVINVVIYLVDELFLNARLKEFGALHPGLFVEHLRVWEILTYGFFHAREPYHVALNMFTLFMFGRDVEGVYGRREYLGLYLTLVVGSGLITALAQDLGAMNGSVIGASGAVLGIVMIFICHFPRRQIYIWGVLPVQAWVLGALFILMNVLGALQVDASGNRTAFWTHIAGIVLGFGFYRTRWQLGRLLPGNFSLKKLRPKPKLRIHDPEPKEGSLSERVDAILEKISREGEDSLTKEERRVLEDASRRYQRRRQ